MSNLSDSNFDLSDYCVLHGVLLSELQNGLTNLERNGGRAGLGFIAAQGNPLLLQPLLVLEMVFHVGQNHVPGGDVHVVGGLVVGPGEKFS